MPADTSQEAFNFSRAGLIAGDQIRTLRTLDEGFARNLTHVLGAWLRSNVAIAPLPAEQQIFGKFADRAATGCHVLPLQLNMEQQQVRGVLSLSLTLAPSIIDLLLGGSGRTVGVGRELTEIEDAVLGSVIELVLREWSAAWAPFGVEFHPEARDRESHGQRLMPLQERVFCCRFQVTLAELSGELLFCMPSAAITATLRAVAHRRDRQRQRTPEERGRMLHRLRGAGVHATLHFPTMRLRTADLRALKPGSLLPLPLARGTPAELRVGGVGVFRAEPVRSGDHRAARVMHALEFNRNGSGIA
jgi:flagellar motor switch protein FliM